MAQYFLSWRKETITWIQTPELKEKLVIYLFLLAEQTQEAWSGQSAQSGQHVTEGCMDSWPLPQVNV